MIKIIAIAILTATLFSGCSKEYVYDRNLYEQYRYEEQRKEDRDFRLKHLPEHKNYTYNMERA